MTCVYHYGCDIILGKKIFPWMHIKHFVYLVDTH